MALGAVPLLSLLLGVAIGVGGLYLAWKQLRRKELAYDVHLYERLLSSSRLLEDHVQIFFEGRPVDDVSIAHLRIWNAGNEAIKRTDYEQPITLSFGQAVPLSVEVLDTKPANVRVNPKVVGRKIDFGRVLMNPHDAIYLQVLLTGPKDLPTLDTRIIGVRRPVRQDFVNDPVYLKRLTDALAWAAAVYMLMYLALLAAPIFHVPQQVGTTIWIALEIATIPVVAILCSVVTIRIRRHYQKKSRW